MTTRAERAVIEAARNLDACWKATIERVSADTAAKTQEAIDQLSAAVSALDREKETITLDEFFLELKKINGLAANRAANRFAHGIRSVWDVEMLSDVAELSSEQVRDVRQAGPKCWRAWADLLRKHGYTPRWEGMIGD